MKAFVIYCHGKPKSRWCKYTSAYASKLQAEAEVNWAKETGVCDLQGSYLVFKIVEEEVMMCSSNGDVAWYIPNKKKPIIYSSQATSNLIVALAHDNYNSTIKELYDVILYNKEAKEVLRSYMSNGYGSIIASSWFH